MEESYSSEDVDLEIDEGDEDILDEEDDKTKTDIIDLNQIVYLSVGQRRAPSKSTVFETAKIYMTRSQMIQNGTDLYIDSIGPDTLENVEKELRDGMCPMTIDRKFTMGSITYIEKHSANELS
jgi:hypothetical protein